jgi:indole-3-glycerol phosphate synthase
MSDRLAPILADARRRAKAIRLDVVQERAFGRPPAPSLEAAIAGPGLAVIAEVKRRSPSRGELAPDLDPVAQATAYADGGAAAISVLTEPNHFSGSDADLEAVEAVVPVPILRKDFTVSEKQIWEARAIGAAAVLLIVSALDQETLERFLDTAADAGLDALVEVHDPDEARRARDAGARIVGVNNRDLTTFEVDLATAEAVRPLLGDASVTVAESGIWTAADARRMADAGYDAVLVGESLVRADDPADLIRELRGG